MAELQKAIYELRIANQAKIEDCMTSTQRRYIVKILFAKLLSVKALEDNLKPSHSTEFVKPSSVEGTSETVTTTSVEP